MTDCPVIIKVDMLTPVGLNALQTAASIRSQVSGIHESYFIDRNGHPLYAGFLPDDVIVALGKELMHRDNLASLEARLLRLATTPLREAALKLPDIENIPLFLCMAKPKGKKDKIEERSFLKILAEQMEVTFDSTRSKIFFMGRAGIFTAIEEAIDVLIRKKSARYVIVGGVDSYCDAYLLDILQQEKRLMLEDVILDGFRPGEGAAFITLTVEGQCKQDNHEVLAYIQGVGKGVEHGHRYSDKPFLGEGLASAFDDFFLSVRNKNLKIQTVFAGFNGESFHAKEWGVTYLRNKKYFEENYQIAHPSEYIGDAGAALAPIMIADAVIGMKKKYYKYPALVWASSDEAERGVLCMTADAM